MLPILNFEDVVKIGQAHEAGKTEVVVSLDLGLSKTTLKLGESGFFIGTDLILYKKPKDLLCYLILDKQLTKAQFF